MSHPTAQRPPRRPRPTMGAVVSGRNGTRTRNPVSAE
jgi:hypothetical protein